MRDRPLRGDEFTAAYVSEGSTAAALRWASSGSYAVHSGQSTWAVHRGRRVGFPEALVGHKLPFSSDRSAVSEMSKQDTTNYKVYTLLAGFGLSRQQLLAVAKVAELHEVRQLRMLRITFDLSLMEAQAELAKFDVEEWNLSGTSDLD
jgi:hypothetical protein